MAGRLNIKWKTLFTQVILWIAAEICLSYLGLDDLADYGEFLLDHHEMAALSTNDHPALVSAATQVRADGQWQLPTIAGPVV